MGFEAFRFRERFKGGLPPGIVPPRAAQCTLRVLFAAFGGTILVATATILAASRQLFARPSSIFSVADATFFAAFGGNPRQLCRHISLSAIFNG